ncbi:MAG: aldolase [Desulfobacterales bacterium]|nr:aldolase [Desulfobacterales bacterium]
MIKDMLKNGKRIIGTWCEIPSAMVINVISKAGMDFVIIDMEHGVMDYKIAQEMVMAAEAEDCEAIIRVPENNESSILRALDTGSSGIIVPHVSSKEDVDNIVMYSKFCPEGNRGYNPYIRSGDYHGGNNDYFEGQNKKIIIAIIIEGKEGLENLDEILLNKHIDVVYIGTYDLSISLGVPGEVKNKKVINTLVEVVKKINDKGKAAGCMVHTSDDLNDFKNMGINFITFKTDTAIIYDSFKKMKKEL